MWAVASNPLGRFFESVGDLLSEDAYVSRGSGSDTDLVTFHTSNGEGTVHNEALGLATCQNNQSWIGTQS